MSAQPPLIEIDAAQRRLTIDGRPGHVRPYEYAVLVELAKAGGHPVARARLLERIWGAAPARTMPDSRMVDQTVARLRQRLGAAADCVETVIGFGYRSRGVVLVSLPDEWHGTVVAIARSLGERIETSVTIKVEGDPMAELALGVRRRICLP